MLSNVVIIFLDEVANNLSQSGLVKNFPYQVTHSAKQFTISVYEYSGDLNSDYRTQIQ